MHITTIDIKDYRGISALHEDVPDEGAIISGGNRKGKTSVLRAIRAALAAQDIGSDAVRIGADKAEIRINLGDVAVRRAISAKGSTTLTVTKDGMQAKAPQRYLTELLGTSPLDPLDLLLCKPKDRRARILEALPITVSIEQIQQWAPDATGDTSGHGLEVIGRFRDAYYDKRTIANKAAADTAAEAARHVETARSLGSPEGPDVEASRRAYEAARDAVTALGNQVSDAEAAAERSKASIARIEALAKEASELAALAVSMRAPESRLAEMRATVEQDKARVAELEADLAKAKAWLLEGTEELARVESGISEATKLDARAAELGRQAGDLRATIDAVAVQRPTDALIAESKELLETRAAIYKRATAAQDARWAKAKAEEAGARAGQAQADAEKLDRIVKALANEAPAALLASAHAIPGLGLDGEDVTLDGVRLDALSGREQMAFCIDVAKRLNPKSKILVVDGLEQIDLDDREAFVQLATSDGFQLLGTLVTRGQAVFGAITPSEAEAAS